MGARRPPSPPPQIAGFTYERLLGTGGFSDVFLYTQHLPWRQVAVKVLLAHTTTPAAREQFVAEANLMARLSTHPSIVTIYHADTASDGRPFLMMEYCSRPNLSVRYRTERIGVAEAIRIGVRLAGAVETAHRAGILHRDIKPANVLTTDYGWPALTDFGISVATTDQGEAESIGMSIPWAAPEFFTESAARGVAGDIYSLAATIHTLLAGRSPFERASGSNSALDLITRIEREPVPATGREDVPESLERVLAKGMAKKAQDRFASAADFARALQRVEQELRLALTALDVPDTSWMSVPDAVGEDIRTRARSVVTVAPLPASPEVLRDDRTVLRDDRTVLRPQTVPAQQVPGDGAPASPPAQEPGPTSGAGQPARPRRRWPVWAASAAVIAGVLAVVVYGVANAPDPEDPTPEPTTAVEETTPAVALHPPAPQTVTGTRDAADPGTVTFTWSVPEFDGGLDYAWRVQGGDGGVDRTTETSVTIVGEGEALCIEVASIAVKANIVSDEWTEGCA
ncbi:MAG: serine/threonine protein kinase [Actinomycetales bacterium]|nr:serine/threonine protein kinase [Actinomycetales bacterium]